MIGGVSGVGQYYVYGLYSGYPGIRAGGGASLAQAGQTAPAVQAGRDVQGTPAAQDGRDVQGAQAAQTSPDVRGPQVWAGQDVQGAQTAQGTDGLPFFRLGADPAELAVRMRIQYPQDAQEEEAAGAESVQEAYKEGQCETCRRRKYQDGSDDPGVSYQTPTHIAPEQAAAAVRGHEMEHVVRETAKAEREDRKVVSQSVMIHTDICPECGKVYISGGTTRTTTAADAQPQPDAAGQAA